MNADEFVDALRDAMTAGEDCRAMVTKMDGVLANLYQEIDNLKRANENLDGRCKWLYSRFDYLLTEIKKIQEADSAGG